MLIAVSNGIRGHPLSEFQVGVTQQPLGQAFSNVTQGLMASGELIRRSYDTAAMRPQRIERIGYLGSRSVDRQAGGGRRSDTEEMCRPPRIRTVPARHCCER